MFALGRRNTLVVSRPSPHGFYLDAPGFGEVLLPNCFVPEGLDLDDTIDVFVYRDSEDRMVATTETPLAMAGEFAVLKVVGLHPRIGAFLDWGLAKDLLLPYREQLDPVRVGQLVTVFIFVDEKSDRIISTTKLKRHLNGTAPAYSPGQAVDIMVANKTELGYSAIVEGAHLGQLYHANFSHRLTPGHRLRAYINTVRPDGKIDLRLDPTGYARVSDLREFILDTLRQNNGRLALDDNSTPEEIRTAFSASKKAFKQALGALYRDRLIQFTHPGIALVKS